MTKHLARRDLAIVPSTTIVTLRSLLQSAREITMAAPMLPCAAADKRTVPERLAPGLCESLRRLSSVLAARTVLLADDAAGDNSANDP